MAEEKKISEGRYGANVALDAINSMGKDEKREDEALLDAEAFIEECDKLGKDPISVVRFVADKNGIELSGKRPDGEKGRLYDVLRDVVDRVVEDIFNEEDDDEEAECCTAPACSESGPIRKCSVIGYAFTW